VAETKSLNQLAELGFNAVDISPSMQKTPTAKATLQALGLEVACVAISHEAPSGETFDSDDPNRVNPLVQYMNQALDHAADIGAGWTYVLPGQLGNDRTLTRLGDHFAALAERGAMRGVKVCIEHFPDTALPTVQATLDFIRDIGHPNLYLLFDIGHSQITKEDPAEVLAQAGDRLAYVHLDDNDGERDLHLALADGIQTHESLAAFFHVLEDIGYDGPVSLELNRTLPNARDAIRRSKQIVEQFIDVD
jgi:hydroxypyruvate isomerase